MFSPGIVTSGNDSYVKAKNIALADADQWPNSGVGKRPPRAILCLTAGNCKISPWDVDSDDITVPAVAGQILLYQPRRVWATGTTGTYAALY